MLFIKVPDGNRMVKVDSAEVIHGIFKMEGVLDSSVIASLYMDDINIMPFVIEKGKIAINNNEAEADDCDFYNLLKDDRISLNDIVIDSLYTSALIDELEKEQYKKIVLLLIEGYSGEEIRNMLHIGYKKYSRYIAEIKDIILMCIG